MAIPYPTDEQIMQDLQAKAPNLESITLVGDLSFGRSEGQLFDNELYKSFDAVSKKKEDGTWQTFRAKVIYQKPDPASPWRFDRTYVFENTIETHGIDKISEAEIIEAIKKTWAEPANVGTWQLANACHVLSLELVPDSIQMRNPEEFRAKVKLTKVDTVVMKPDNVQDLGLLSGVFEVNFKKMPGQEGWFFVNAFHEKDSNQTLQVLASDVPYEKRSALPLWKDNPEGLFGPEHHVLDSLEHAGKLTLPTADVLDQWVAGLMQNQPRVLELHTIYSMKDIAVVPESIGLEGKDVLHFDVVMTVGMQKDNGKGNLTADMVVAKKTYTVNYRHSGGTDWQFMGAKLKGEPQVESVFRADIPLSDFNQLPTFDLQLKARQQG